MNHRASMLQGSKSLWTVLLLISVSGTIGWRLSQSALPTYRSGIVDLTLMVRDVEQAVAFYKRLGFEEHLPTTVPNAVAVASGWSEKSALPLRVLALPVPGGATLLKLMPRIDSLQADSSPNHSATLPADASEKSEKRDSDTVAPDLVTSAADIQAQLGLSCLTLQVSQLESVLEAAQATGVPILTPKPAALDPNRDMVLIRDPDGHLLMFVCPNGNRPLSKASKSHVD